MVQYIQTNKECNDVIYYSENEMPPTVYLMQKVVAQSWLIYPGVKYGLLVLPFRFFHPLEMAAVCVTSLPQVLRSFVFSIIKY